MNVYIRLYTSATFVALCQAFMIKKPKYNWAEARLKIARMTLTIKRDGNWSSFQLANSALPLSVTSSAIAPSARLPDHACKRALELETDQR